MRDPRNIMEINLPDVDTSRRYGVMDEPKIKQHWSITLLPCAKIEYGHMVERRKICCLASRNAILFRPRSVGWEQFPAGDFLR